MASVLVCDGSPLVREQLRRAAGTLAEVDRVVLAATESEALAHVRAHPPDLVLMEIGATPRDGAGVIRRIRALDQTCRVLVLVRPDDPDSAAVAAVAAGARGYVRTDASATELRVALGQALSEPHGAGAGAAPYIVDAQAEPALNERELEVLAGMCEGRSNAEIGAAMFLTEDTVKTHARRMFRKLGASDRANAVAIAMRRGLVR